MDIAEFSAEVSNHYPFQVVRFSQVENDPGLKFTTGGSGSSRKLHMLLAKNIEAGRLVAGFTISEPGNWTRCVVPEYMFNEMGTRMVMGGTSLLIVVNVTVDTISQIQSHLLAHQYGDLIKKAKLKGRLR